MKPIKTLGNNTNKYKCIICFLLFVGVLACSKDDAPPAPEEIVKNSTKQITSFVFLHTDNPIDVDIQAAIDEINKTITAKMPVGTSITALNATIEISPLATINPASIQDFTGPATYTVTAEDGSKSEYTVTLYVPSTQKDALQALINDNGENTLDWDLLNTSDSDLGNLDGVETDVDGNITSLFVSSKNIREVSPEIGLLSHLELLSLDGNPIRTLPAEIGQLTALREISLKDNQLTSIPVEIGLLINLEILSIENNPISILPPEIGSLRKLRRLDLKGNQITSLPPEMAFLTKLKFLFLEESNLDRFPSSIYQLTLYNNLAIIGQGVLASIVSQKDALLSIYSANPDNTLDWGVDHYPEIEFHDNGNPRTITMNNKNLSMIPNVIDKLKELEVLNVNNNFLKSLPKGLANIKSLTVITAASNELITIPSEFGSLNNLGLLSLTNNPITGIPLEVCNLKISNGGILTLLTDFGEGCD